MFWLQPKQMMKMETSYLIDLSGAPARGATKT